SLFGDHVDIIFLHMLLEAGDQLRAFGVGYGDEVLDTHGVHHLATKALSHQTGANAFTGRVDGCSSASRATTNDQYFVGLLLAQLGRLALGGAGVDLVDDLGQCHAALAKVFAVQEHGGHSHDLAALDLVLEQGAIDHHVGDVRVQGGHQVQRLDHVGAVLAGQGDIGLEMVFAFEIADLVKQCRVSLGRVTTGLQQGQNQGSELVTHRDTGEAYAGALAGFSHGHARGTLVFHGNQTDLARHFGNFDREFVQFFALGAVVYGHADFDRLGDVLQVRVQLLLQIGVQHSVRVLESG